MHSRTSALVAAALACAAAFGVRAAGGQEPAGAVAPRDRVAPAVAFLTREVPRWRAEQGCYSCHNNGDAVRALIAASASGFDVGDALSDTLAFLGRPGGWASNSRGGPSDDQALARIQFAGALADAVEAGLAPREAIADAAALVAADQQPDGSWRLDPSNSLGSPATYGTALATWAARRVLVASGAPTVGTHIARADSWLRQAPVAVTPDAAAVLLALGEAADTAADAQRARALAFLLDTQGADGGWGPYSTVRAETFDTAIAVIALASQPPSPETAAYVDRGRAYLARTRLDDGSWVETTRPPGQQSYAQLISTTGWAVIALLK